MFKYLTFIVLAFSSTHGGEIEAPKNLQFHLALVTNDLDGSLNFYKKIFQRKVVKLDDKNGFIDFYGTILAFTEDKSFSIPLSATVTKEQIPYIQTTSFVPSSHFGTPGFSEAEFNAVIERVREVGNEFIIESTIVNREQPTEQIFAFVLDPQGYVIELRSLKNEFNLDQIRDYAQQEEANIKEKI